MQYSRTLFATALATLLLSACGGGQESKPAVGIDPQVYTDSLFAVMNADRTNYTKMIIGRLGPAGADSIKPHEYWEDLENGAPLPAQMFRYGAEAVAEVSSDFSYSLQSLWPINSQNAPKTELEKEGLQYIVDNPGKNFYGTEALGDTLRWEPSRGGALFPHLYRKLDATDVVWAKPYPLGETGHELPADVR